MPFCEILEPSGWGRGAERCGPLASLPARMAARGGSGSSSAHGAAGPGRREALWFLVFSLLRPPFSHHRSWSFYHKDPQAAPPSGALPPPPPASSLSCSKQTAFEQQRLAHQLEGQHRPRRARAHGEASPPLLPSLPTFDPPSQPLPLQAPQLRLRPLPQGNETAGSSCPLPLPCSPKATHPNPSPASPRRASRTPAGFDSISRLTFSRLCYMPDAGDPQPGP